MLPGHHWARQFTVNDADVEYLINLLLERETPMTTEGLALLLLNRRLDEKKRELEAQYRDVALYNPAQHYGVGQKLIFSQMDFAVGTVVAIRDGDNPDYGDFSVVSVEFENKGSAAPREFATDLQIAHKLNFDQESNPLTETETLSAEDILNANREAIMQRVSQAAATSDLLVRVAGYWFPRDLVMDVDIGHLHLAEAVIDMLGDKPQAPETILGQIGGIGDAPQLLQAFSLNLALNNDDRFDEVGPLGHVRWYLHRLEPEWVRRTPPELSYRPIDYDPRLLTAGAAALEQEIRDEYSDLAPAPLPDRRAQVTLIYPHRRVGTLPLNTQTQQVFPTATTPRIYVEMLDTTDGEVFPGWVVHEKRYVYGLEPYYSKHLLPVGAYIEVERGERPDQIRLSYSAYRPRTEWIRLAQPADGRLTFENNRRSIGADYDDLMIVGVDDLKAVDALAAETLRQQRSLVSILRALIQDLSKLTPQGTVHAITLYSALNILRRCPPGPIFATLIANPEFEDVGDNYWRVNL